MNAKRWLKQHQYVLRIRPAMDLCERLYEIARDVKNDARPAAQGGWPARIFPFRTPRPYGRRELRELRRAVRAQHTSYADGDALARFERLLAARWRAKHAIAVSSGTSALHAALIAAGIGPGDEVIVPALTHVSTALAVLYQGAVPRFVDAHPDSWNIDPAQIEAQVSERTRAILPVHLGGVPCDMDAIQGVATRHGLVIIEDAAQAHGASYGTKSIGTLGRLGCFSFQSTKTMTTGEGGAVLTDDDELARRVRLAMNIGESTGRGRATADMADFRAGTPLAYEIVGWNYRMSALQASLGIGQLERLDAMCAARNANAARLWEHFSGLSGVRRQAVPTNATPVYSSFFVELTPGSGGPGRDELARMLAEERIDVRLPYPKPLSAHPIFGQPGEHPIAQRICDNAIGFRVDPSLGRRAMDTVGFALRRIFAWSRSHPSEDPASRLTVAEAGRH